jgi:hypothetical protein
VFFSLQQWWVICLFWVSHRVRFFWPVNTHLSLHGAAT